MPVGTLPWTFETRGILRGRDRIRLLGQALILESRTLSGRLRRSLGLTRSHLARLDLDQLPVPDSPAARRAEEVCAMTPAVVDHSYRTYLWAAALAACDGISYDAELLYVASLVHDIGFPEPQYAPDGSPCCLSFTGAQAALEVGADAGWDQDRSEAAAEAITLHVNLWVRRRSGPEAYLMFAGARLDQTGFRYWDLAPETEHAVLERHPRTAWKATSCAMMKRQAKGSRADFYTRYLAANWFIKHAPFEE
jgi:HD domain.